MKKKLFIIILVILLLSSTAAIAAAGKPISNYLNCTGGTACTVDAEGGSTVNVWFLGSCSSMPVQNGILIICNE